MSTQENVRIGGFSIRKTTSADLAAHLLMRRQQGKQVALFFANTNFIVKCRDLRVRMAQEGVVIANDGVGMDIAASLMQGEHFEENLNGTDFVPFLFRQSATPLRVFMIGGKPTVLRQAAWYVTRQLGQTVVGMCDGYRCVKTRQNLLDSINMAEVDILLVALGNPIQEKWILEHRRRLNVPILAGVGALFDFWAGDKPRAPILVQKMRMEWLFRLCLEPKRLAQRYTVDIAKFLKYCYQYRLDDRPRG